jgi:hypothetical protein
MEQKFYGSLNEMLNVCLFSNGEITTQDLLDITEDYKSTRITITDLLTEIVVLRQKNEALTACATNIRGNTFYQRRMRNKQTRKLMTMEEKCKSPLYSPCDFCDNIVKDVITHQKNECCSSNQLKKHFARHPTEVYKTYNKELQLINLYVREYMKKPNPKTSQLYWKYVYLYQNQYNHTHPSYNL